jgi:hypothetical protein
MSFLNLNSGSKSGRNWLRVAICSGVALVAAQALPPAAMAFNGPANIKIDGGPLGPLELSGGFNGYGYALSGTGNSTNYGLLGTDKTTGAELMNGLIQLQKSTGLMQFTIEVGSTTSLVLGTKPLQTSVQTFSTGPLYAGYVTLAPSSNFSVSIGQLGSQEGYESGVDWNNTNVLSTDIFYVENSQSRGVEATYSAGKVSATVEFGDGFDTGVWNFVQALATYTINSNNALSVFGATNLGRTGPNANIYGNATSSYNQTFVSGYGPYYVNSTMLGAYYSYTMGNLNVVPEVQYVYAKPDAILAAQSSDPSLNKFSSNFGAAVFADYQFGKSDYSLAGWGEYFTSKGPDNWFINAGAKGVGISIAPTWQKNDLFVRGDVGLLHLTTVGVPGSPGYGASGTSRNQATALIEAGVLF